MATVTRGALKLEEIMGAEASDLLNHKCGTVPASQLHLPGPDFVDRVWKDSDRPTRVLRSLQTLFGHGRRLVCPQPDLLRRRKDRRAGDRRQLQRGRVHLWRARIGGPTLRASNSV